MNTIKGKLNITKTLSLSKEDVKQIVLEYLKQNNMFNETDVVNVAPKLAVVPNDDPFDRGPTQYEFSRIDVTITPQ